MWVGKAPFPAAVKVENPMTVPAAAGCHVARQGHCHAAAHLDILWLPLAGTVHVPVQAC